VFDGPIFSQPIAFEVGETVYRSYSQQESSDDKDSASSTAQKWDTDFWYTDLIPV
jgi:hypothetical protein